jgi:DNA-directed RNA polymerase subunit M/transcription elongation factor TFIIS
MHQTYEIDCPECEELTYAQVEDDDNYPRFCPMCGAEAEVEITDIKFE